jgi:hypothetical protein
MSPATTSAVVLAPRMAVVSTLTVVAPAAAVPEPG